MPRDPYLVPPGKRKKNKYYIIRGYFDGKPDNEKSTGTTDAELANRMLARVIYSEKCGIIAREEKQFGFVADRYIDWKNPSERQRKLIDALRKFWQKRPITEVEEDIVAVANKMYPTEKASTKNRAVGAVAYAILNYASKPPRRWCERPAMEKFEEEPVPPRKTTIEIARKLVAGTTSDKQLLLLWLFKHSDRITGTVNVLGPHIHLDENYYDRLTGKKKKKWVKAPLDPEVKAKLIALYGSKLPQGRIFPWSDRWQVYDWLTPLCKKLGVKFTPHVARHSILSWIGDAGGNEIQIKTRAGHASLKSSEPYLAANLDITREITARFVLVEKTPILLEPRGISRGSKSAKAKKHA